MKTVQIETEIALRPFVIEIEYDANNVNVRSLRTDPPNKGGWRSEKVECPDWLANQILSVYETDILAAIADEAQSEADEAADYKRRAIRDDKLLGL